MKNTGILYTLQGIRIFAAFIVLLFHIIYIFEDKVGIEGPRALFTFGKTGVHLFFVLSGYVMYMIHQKDIGQGFQKATSFGIKRIVRIYPTYWILTTIVVVGMLFLPGEVKTYKNSFWYLFQTYSLIDMGLMDDGLPIITPAWSLFHEIKFYLFFLLLILIKNRFLRMFLTTVLLALTFFFMLRPTSNQVISFYFSGFNLLFLFGVLSAWVTDKYTEKFKSRYYILLGSLSYVVMSLFSNLWLMEDTPFTDLLFGVASFIVVTALACNERYFTYKNGENPFKMGKKGLFMADATYCLYLIHIPVYIVVFHANKILGLGPVLFSVFMLVMALIASLIYHGVIERPLLNWIKGIIGKKRTPVLGSKITNRYR